MIKRIFNVLYYLVFSCLVIICISLLLTKIKNPVGTPNILGYKVYVEVTNSMAPIFYENDILIVRNIQENQLNVGDIIAFRENKSTITHRIISINKENGTTLYTTKGDNNNIEDKEKVRYELIEGKYIGKIPKIGFLVVHKIYLIGIILVVTVSSLLFKYILKNQE